MKNGQGTKSAAKRRFALWMLPIGFVLVGGVVWLVHIMLGLMMLGYVDSAIATLRTIGAAEAEFRKTHPEQGYSCSLSELGTGADYRTLTKRSKWNGYTFEIRGCNAGNDRWPTAKYQATAQPLRDRLPAYCLDETDVLMWDPDGSVTKCVESHRLMNQ